MSGATSQQSPNPFALAADVFDPPPWQPADRPPLEAHQRPPEGDWNLWLLEGGRGCGKTEACARYFATYMHANPGHRGRIIAPTFADAVESAIRGPSGLTTIDPEIRWMPSDPGGSKVVWPNGSEALVLGTPFPRDVDRLRAGGNRHLDWWEEMAANTQLSDAWDQAALGLRLGTYPHSIASTTPRTTPAYRTLRGQDGVVFTHATLFDNPHNPPQWVAQMKARYEGTRLARQELGGELIEDVEGSLWTRGLLEEGRVAEVPALKRVVVAIDPAATSTDGADDTGIIVAGLGEDGDGYVFDDRTCHLSPNGWGSKAVAAYERHEADRIVAEANNGGEMVEHVIRTVNPDVPVRLVHASRGKQIRAEPIAALYEQKRVHHVGGFPELEDQLCTWTPEDRDSPDRLDALVWGLSELMTKRTVPTVGPVSVAGQSSWR